MAIHTRQDFFENLSTGIDTRQIYRTSQLVSQLTGFVIQPNKAIVGRNAFAHESGIHVDGILKKRETYEIMTPQMIGLESSRVVLGRHSGRHAFLDRCKQLGYDLAENEIENAYQKFLELADRKKEIFDEDIAAIINNEVRSVEKMFDLNYLLVACGTGTLPTASVRVRVRDQIRQAAAYGDGPVDAAYEAIRQAVGKAPKLISYSIRAITEGKDALGETTVRIENEQGRRFIGRGVSTDIIEASAKAYVDAINRMVAAETNGSAEQPKATI
jgi:2-isopropylmalate synthase